MNAPVRARARRAARVSIDDKLFERAQGLKIDVAKTLEHGLARALASRQAAEWTERNRAALDTSNAFVERHGLPLVQFRNF